MAILRDDKDRAEFIINEAYDIDDIIPLVCILSGSRAYGNAKEESDYDYIGIHVVDTWNLLEHPNFTNTYQVIKRKYNSNGREYDSNEKDCNRGVNLISFELWKFISLYLKGDHKAFQLLYMPVIHENNNVIGKLISLCQQGIHSQNAKLITGELYRAIEELKSGKQIKTRTIMYHALQTLLFLEEQEFEWNAASLFNIPIPTNEKAIIKEFQLLIDRICKAARESNLPEECPEIIIKEILLEAKHLRGKLI